MSKTEILRERMLEFVIMEWLALVALFYGIVLYVNGIYYAPYFCPIYDCPIALVGGIIIHLIIQIGIQFNNYVIAFLGLYFGVLAINSFPKM
jgi:hypothetical protein